MVDPAERTIGRPLVARPTFVMISLPMRLTSLHRGEVPDGSNRTCRTSSFPRSREEVSFAVPLRELRASADIADSRVLVRASTRSTPHGRAELAAADNAPTTTVSLREGVVLSSGTGIAPEESLATCDGAGELAP